MQKETKKPEPIKSPNTSTINMKRNTNTIQSRKKI